MICAYCQFDNPANVTTCRNCGSSLQDIRLPVGTALAGGQYVIQGVLGQGGFGITYEAYDASFKALVAVKELFPTIAMRGANGSVILTQNANQDFGKLRDHAKREAQTLNQLRHPSIVQVKAVFEERNTVYIVTELLKGETLAQRIHRGTLSESEARGFLARLLDALEQIHTRGLLHRDLKPDNIMLTPHGPVLIDFGTALEFTPNKTIFVTSAVLTPAFAPLEQFAQKVKLGPPTDFYALGATLYYALTGVLPSSAADRGAGVNLPPVRSLRPDLSNELCAAIDRALEMRVDARPQSTQDFMGLLIGTSAAPNSATPSLPKTVMVTPSSPPVVQVVPPNSTPPQTTVRIKATGPKGKSKLGFPIAVAAAVAVIGFFGYRALTSAGETPMSDTESSSTIWKPEQVEVAASRLNVRAGAGTNYAITQVNGRDQQLQQGEVMPILDEQDGWYKIQVGGKEGWIRHLLTVPVGPIQGSSETNRVLKAAYDGGTVTLSDGVYILTNTLLLSKNVELIGQGRDRTYLVSATSGPTLAFAGKGTLKLRNFTLAHRGPVAAPVAKIAATQLEISNMRFIGARDNAADNPDDGDDGDGLVIAGETKGRVENSEFVANRWRGTSVRQKANVTLEGNTFAYNSGSGLAYFDLASGNARKNTSRSNSLAGMKITGKANPSLENNTFEDNAKADIHYRDAAAGSASGNTCSDANKPGIQLETIGSPGLSNNTGCTIKRPTVEAPPVPIQTQQIAQTQTSSPQAFSAGFETYSDPGLGFSVSVPFGWIRTVESNRDFTRVKWSHPNDEYTNFLVDVNTDPRNDGVAPLQSWYEQDDKLMRKYRGRYERILINSDILSGLEAAQWRFILDRDDQPPLQKLDVGTRVNGRGYAILFTAHNSSFSNLEPMFSQIQASMQIRR
jgi:serine/threonine protein kinase